MMVQFVKFSATVLLCTVTLLTGALCKDYCEEESCGAEHTMCKYPNEQTACRSAVGTSGLTDELREAILDRHNHYRQSVALGNEYGQPPASNMMKLTWNFEAEKIAQRWVNQCKGLLHDSCRTIQNSNVGQNVGYMIFDPSKDDLKERVMWIIDLLWFSDHYSLDSLKVDRFVASGGDKNNTKDDYTQIVWAETTSVGCGLLIEKFFLTSFVHLACNYAPGGNIPGQPVYKRGEACGECPLGSRCSQRYPGLCTDDHDDGGTI